mgnify:FL=1
MASTTRATAANVQITGVLDMRENWITDLPTDLSVYPVEPDHGATKQYVDKALDGILNEIPVNVDNGDF